MKAVEQRAYRWEIEKHIKTDDFKEFPEKELIAVLKDKVEISSLRTKKPNKQYKATTVYARGEVLHTSWRRANTEEASEWKKLSEEKLKELGIIRRNDELWIPIIMKIKDLRAAVRQRMRHIITSLVGKEEEFVLSGEAKILADYSRRLIKIIQCLQEKDANPEFIEKASKDYKQISAVLLKSRSKLLESAAKEIDLANKEKKVWQGQAHSGKALSLILDERARKYEIAVKSFYLGLKWLNFYEHTIQQWTFAYRRLGKIAQELQELKGRGRPFPDHLILEISGIYIYLSGTQGSYFDPFCERLYSPEVRSLSEVLRLADKGEWDRIENIVLSALAKIEIIVKGELPSKEEILKTKKTLE